MECDVCEKPGPRRYFCETCLDERLLIHKSALKRLAAAHEATVERASQLLHDSGGVQERRILKARVSSLTLLNQKLESEQLRQRGQLEAKRAELDLKSKELIRRRALLQEAKKILQEKRESLLQKTPSKRSSDVPIVHPQLATIQQHWDHVSESLMIVRRNLLAELFSIYPITVNDSPPISKRNTISSNLSERKRRGGEMGANLTRIEWRILGYCLPVSTEVQLYHHEEVSAAALCSSHLLRLTAMYLGIKLPFQMVMGPALSIRAPRRSPWSQKHSSFYPLFLPSPTPMSLVSSPSTPSAPHISFLTGLCMLAYNVYYIRSTQTPNQTSNPEQSSSSPSKAQPASSPPPKPTELLQNLHGCFQSRGLGTFSHVTGKTRLKVLNDPNNFTEIELESIIKEVLNLKKKSETFDGEWSIV